MKSIRAAGPRFLGLLRKKRRDAEMAEEMQTHLDALTERKVAAGLSPAAPSHASSAREDASGARDFRPPD